MAVIELSIMAVIEPLMMAVIEWTLNDGLDGRDWTLNNVRD